MKNDQSMSTIQNGGGQFDATLGLKKFNIPVVQGGSQANTEPDNNNPGNNANQMPAQPNDTEGISIGVPPTQPPVAGQPPVSNQIFLEDILRRNIGAFVSISASFNNVIREFRGNIVEVGTNVVTIEDRRVGSRVILPTLFINYVDVPVF